MASFGLSFSVGCGQSVRPDHALGRRLGEGLGELRRVGVGRRADLGVHVGAGELHPGPALVDQPADDGVGRVRGAGVLRDAPHVVEHDRRRQAVEDVLDADDLVAEHVDLHVPAEVVDALRQRLEHVDRRRAGLHQVEADAAHAEIVQALELGVGHARVDDGDAARRRPDLRHAVQRAGIVGAVGRGLHYDVARRADALLQEPVVVGLGVGRLQGRARRDREAAVVDVHVAVAGVLRRVQLRRLGAGRPRHLVLGLRPRRRRGEDARAKRRRSEALQDPTAFQWLAHDCLRRRRTRNAPGERRRHRA